LAFQLFNLSTVYIPFNYFRPFTNSPFHPAQYRYPRELRTRGNWWELNVSRSLYSARAAVRGRARVAALDQEERALRARADREHLLMLERVEGKGRSQAFF
jgi:hypothetical protein